MVIADVNVHGESMTKSMADVSVHGEGTRAADQQIHANEARPHVLMRRVQRTNQPNFEENAKTDKHHVLMRRAVRTEQPSVEGDQKVIQAVHELWRSWKTHKLDDE